MSSKTKITYEYVKNYFIEQECELISTEYINNKTKMKYKCKCGNESSIVFNNFKNGQRCKKCKSSNYINSKKLTFEYVKNYFTEQQCELLETEYKNNNTKMKYKCKCGNISNIIFNNVKKKL